MGLNGVTKDVPAGGSPHCNTEQLLGHFLPKRCVPMVMQQIGPMHGAVTGQAQDASSGAGSSTQPRNTSAVSRMLRMLILHPSMFPGLYQQFNAHGMPQAATSWASSSSVMEQRYSHSFNTSAQSLDELHALLLLMIVGLQMAVMALSVGASWQEGLLRLFVPVLIATAGPVAQSIWGGSFVARRPLVVAGMRVAATIFNVWAVVARPGALPACSGVLALALGGSGVGTLLSWALLNPLELRHHVPVQLLQLSFVLAGNAFVYRAGSQYASLLPLPLALALQYAIGFVLPTLMLYLYEQEARRVLIERSSGVIAARGKVKGKSV